MKNSHKTDSPLAQSDIYDVIVIGGGASGLMSAGRAGELGKKVLIIEKNRELGNKLKITGGGRCNITNAEFDVRELLKHYGKSEQFLYTPFSQFGIADTFKFFESRGLKIVVEARKRAFPETQRAYDVFRVMHDYCKCENISIITNSPVSKFMKENNKIIGVKAGDRVFHAKSYILATGGMSHPETGSTGDGFRWLADLGHVVKKPTPTIVPLAVSDRWARNLSGVSLSFMKITFCVEGKKKFSKTGKILFTHFGISGPLILNSSSQVNDLLQEGAVTAKIDAYPDTNEKELEEKIINIFDQNKNKMFKNIIDAVVPHGTINAILELVPEIPPETKVHSISRESRKKLVSILKAIPLTITGLMGYERAVIADGGVKLEEIDMKTMRSKILDNLFITGDLLHVTRPSGGYSLQLCWTTGYIAGENA